MKFRLSRPGLSYAQARPCVPGGGDRHSSSRRLRSTSRSFSMYSRGTRLLTALVAAKSALLRFRLAAKPPPAPLRLLSPRKPFHLRLRGGPALSAYSGKIPHLQGEKCFQPRRSVWKICLRHIFSAGRSGCAAGMALRAAAENRFYAFRAFGRETLRGFLTSCAPIPPLSTLCCGPPGRSKAGRRRSWQDPGRTSPH